MPPTVLVVQNVALGPIGVLGEELVNCGAQLVTWLPEQQPGLPSGEYAGLVIMGGPMGAYDDEQFPHLPRIVDLIHQFHQDDKPILGVCLGAQLIARAFGSNVYPHSAPELGFTAVTVADETATEPWLRTCPTDLKLMEWHFDTFDLPEAATLLMTGEFCPHQAFRIGTKTYGFQFHLEATADIIADWQTMQREWLQANYPDLEQQFQTQMQTYGTQSAIFARKVAQDWFALMQTPVATLA